MAILMKGPSGEPVKRLQRKLDVAADGTFGPASEKHWKTKHSPAAYVIARLPSGWPGHGPVIAQKDFAQTLDPSYAGGWHG